VEVEAAYYSAPPGWIGRRVQGFPAGSAARSAEWPAVARTHAQLLCRANKAGSQIGAFCRDMHQAQGQVAVRRIMGVLSLGKKYGVARVDDACAVALEVGGG